MNDSLRIGAVILAAGSSSRMGETKQLLKLENGTALVAQALDCVRAARIDEIVLVLGHEAEKVRAAIGSRELKIVVNERYTEGMSTSLALGLASLGERIAAAFVVLGDQPFIQSATLNLLIDRYEQTHAPIVLPTHNGARGNPVLLDRSIFAEVVALTGDVGARAIFGNHTNEILKVPVDDPGILLDFDNREDWENFQRLPSADQRDNKS
jgi:molybdenum cofactor cytidylyltransferase